MNSFIDCSTLRSLIGTIGKSESLNNDVYDFEYTIEGFLRNMRYLATNSFSIAPSLCVCCEDDLRAVTFSANFTKLIHRYNVYYP